MGRGSISLESRDPHRKPGETANEQIAGSLGSTGQLYRPETLQSFLPQNTELHLGKAVTHTPVNTRTKG
jgi:hypothetical protein